MSPHWRLSKEPLWLCPSKDGSYLGVALCFLESAPGDGPGARQGGSFFAPPDVEAGGNHSSRNRREAAGFISGRAALVECLHLKTATENGRAHFRQVMCILYLPQLRAAYVVFL